MSSLHWPTLLSPAKGSQAIWMASSWQAEMQCSSLPQVSGNASTAIPSWMASDFGPQASTHKLHPVHCPSRTIGTHLQATQCISDLAQVRKQCLLFVGCVFRHGLVEVAQGGFQCLRYICCRPTEVVGPGSNLNWHILSLSGERNNAVTKVTNLSLRILTWREIPNSAIVLYFGM